MGDGDLWTLISRLPLDIDVFSGGASLANWSTTHFCCASAQSSLSFFLLSLMIVLLLTRIHQLPRNCIWILKCLPNYVWVSFKYDDRYSLKEMQSCIPLNKAINPASKALVVEIASVKVPTITPVWFWMIPPMPDVIQSGISEPSKLKFSKEGTLASVTHHLYDFWGKRSLCISIKTLCKFCFVPMICIVNGEFGASLKLTIW